MESSTITPNGSGPADEAQLDAYSPFEQVTLGEHTYTVYEQRIGHLENKLKKTFGKLVEAKIDGSDELLGAFVTGPAYKILRVFVPKLMPEWEFNGYPTEEAWRAGEYEERYDKSPGPTQIRRAMEAGMRVNSIDLFKHIAGFFSETTRHAIVDEMVLAGIAMMKQSGLRLPSASVPITDGPSTTSGMTDPTAATVTTTEDSS